MFLRLSGIAAAVALAAGLSAAAVGGAQAATVSFAEAMGILARDCGKDVQAYCKGVPLANNAVGSCLMQNQGKVSPVCIQSLTAVRASISQRLQAQAEVLKVCRGDAARRCQGVVQGDAHLLDCLLKAANHVTKKCNAAITDAGWR